MGRKESNQTNKNHIIAHFMLHVHTCLDSLYLPFFSSWHIYISIFSCCNESWCIYKVYFFYNWIDCLSIWKKKFNDMRKKASSQSTHIYLKNYSYLVDIIRHLSVKCFNVAAAVKWIVGSYFKPRPRVPRGFETRTNTSWAWQSGAPGH